MSQMPCRDCRTMIPRDAKGCPTCARNLVAERALGKVVLLVAALALVFICTLMLWLFKRTAF